MKSSWTILSMMQLKPVLIKLFLLSEKILKMILEKESELE